MATATTDWQRSITRSTTGIPYLRIGSLGQGNQVAPVGSSLYYYYEVAPIHVQNYAIVYNHVISTSITNQVLAGCQLLQPGLQRLRN